MVSIQINEIRKPRRAQKMILVKEAAAGYLFIAPNSLGLLLFYIVPIFMSLFMGFFDWDGMNAAGFNGIRNFTGMAADKQFGMGLINTFKYTIITVPCTIVLSTLLATALNRSMHGKIVYRTFYFLPVMTMPVAVAMVWKWLFNMDYGLLNYFLGILGIPRVAWLSDERFILAAIMIVGIWSSVGYNMVIILSGLQEISGTYYEAAHIDGASPFKTFTRVTLPLLTPSIFFVLVTSLISATQVFDSIFVILGPTKGSLRDAARSIVLNIYESGFVFFKMGYASAQTIFLFAIILILTFFQFVVQKKWVHYDA